jgi:hypothetical protein
VFFVVESLPGASARHLPLKLTTKHTKDTKGTKGLRRLALFFVSVVCFVPFVVECGR